MVQSFVYRMRRWVAISPFLFLHAEAVLGASPSTPAPACHFSGDFTQQKRLAGVARPVVSNGQFLYSCERGVIWQVEMPESDVLVLRADPGSNKSRAFRIVEQHVEPLKGRQSRFLTQLIMSLMAGDQAALQSQFEVTQEPNSVVVLTPKKRALKRVIKRIEVSSETGGDVEGPKGKMQIRMIDRNGQITQINAHQKQRFDALSQALCEQASMSKQACGLLYDDA